MFVATCYMCTAAANSREHVPPKCLFPEPKDIGENIDLRKNLITVPSCVLHNSAKSKDDEYLLLGITLNILNNGTALSHFQTKIMRALTRNPKLFGYFAKSQQEVVAVDKDGTAINTLMVKVDNRRFLGSLEHVARGLYYHAYQSRFDGKCSILPDFMLYAGSEEDVRINDRNSTALHIIKPTFDSVECNGENQSVFSYVFLEPDDQGRIALRMQFFGGSNVYVAFLPAAT